ASLYFLRPALRLSIASVWIITGIISLWIYPRESSEHLLIQAGVSEEIAPYLLNGLAVTDIGLGIGTWMKWHMSIISITQLCLIIAYSLVIATVLPEFVIHPFGAIVKNGPLFVATMVMMALEGDR
ncbi:MAG: DoxX-like family protein, partial [Nitrospira sp.]|nr:DoxX-like family protein [Nitrospira sp.]